MAANQTRRRTELGSAPTISDGSQPLKTFVYQPLDPDPEADSIRLVLIEPSVNNDALISCRLSHVQFKQKPKFRALSYTWGNEAVKERILLNGEIFYVGQNLHDALHYIRNSGSQIPLWVDAICINQDDIPERNRQLRIMKWIYFRADTVVVWLGKKYSRYQLGIKGPEGQHTGSHDNAGDELLKPRIIEDRTMESKEPDILPPGLKQKSSAEGNHEERAMVAELCTDGYWNRLWIIQELGQAAQKEVCFGNLAMDWNAFIELATLHNINCDGPLRLNRLFEEKYSGSHTLRQLLENHRNASCKEPRDKIYGLVGLAVDAFGFPMDYTKSLIEVWKDTMEFMNRRGLLPEADLITVGKLVKYVLIGADLGPLEQALQPYEPQPNSAFTIEDSDSDRIFQLDGYIVGCLMAVGPSITEIISNVRKADQWGAEIQHIFRHDLGQAHRENIVLMRAILQSEEPCLSSKCFSHVSNVRWKNFRFGSNNFSNFSNSEETCARVIKELQSKCSDLLRTMRQKSPGRAPVASTNSHLFLNKSQYRNKTDWKMGIASGLAQPGDLICWVHGVERAIIVRVNMAEHTFQIFGTALFTADFQSNTNDSHEKRFSSFREDEEIKLNMDAATVYVLIA